jgi:hypothetical protein
MSEQEVRGGPLRTADLILDIIKRFSGPALHPLPFVTGPPVAISCWMRLSIRPTAKGAKAGIEQSALKGLELALFCP